MNTRRFRNWFHFKREVIHKYLHLPNEGRSSFWFRGQSHAAWPLQTTLDRFRVFPSDTERNAFAARLLRGFHQELVGLQAFQAMQGMALELLARHHGLPSALLDWTESPYIAAFFAFQSILAQPPPRVTIWAFHQLRLPQSEEIEIIREKAHLWYNHRALEQRGVFMRINTISRTPEEILGTALTKFELPGPEAPLVLADLEAMSITARNLFRDLDGAARTAFMRAQLS